MATRERWRGFDARRHAAAEGIDTAARRPTIGERAEAMVTITLAGVVAGALLGWADTTDNSEVNDVEK